MRNIILANQAPHGLGPIIRTAEMAQSLYSMLKSEGNRTEYEIVLTEPEKGFIKNILQNETFVGDEALEHVWLSQEYGNLVNALDYSKPDYKDRLETIATNRLNLEKKLVSLLKSGMGIYRLAKPEETKKITASDILCEVSHNPILRTTLDNSYPMFYTTIGLFSEILEYAPEVNVLYKDKSLQKLLQVCIKEAKTIESSQEVLMIAEPSAMAYKGKPAGENIMEIPPFIRPPKGSKEALKEGVYLNISGIDSVQQQIASLAKPFIDAGYAVYYSPSYKEGIDGGIQKAPVENGKSIFSNPAIIAAVGRMGWSSVWEPMMNGNPFITYEYDAKEDPEMHHNVKTLEKLNLGVIMRLGDDPEEVMAQALELGPKIKLYVSGLKDKYGTLNGIEYAARVIYNRLKL